LTLSFLRSRILTMGSRTSLACIVDFKLWMRARFVQTHISGTFKLAQFRSFVRATLSQYHVIGQSNAFLCGCAWIEVV
jgi:hypothetical protein